MKWRKRLWWLALAASSPATLNLSCSTEVGSTLRDAALAGASGVIQEAVAIFLADLLLPPGD